MSNKKLNIHLPTIDIHYWTLMILATTIGEIVGNIISRNLGLGYATGSTLLLSTYTFSIIAIALSGKENATVYWLLIVLGNIAGTNCADFITIEPLKLGTIWGSVFVMGILTAILVLWKVVSPRSNVESGLNGKTFLLYWFAILTSSTFGTTFGDLLSNDTPLGAGGGTVVLSVILIAFVLLNRYTGFSKEILYWAALVVIHPIGATIGNYISKPAGLNLGNIWTSVALVTLFFALFIADQRRQLALKAR